MPWTNQPGGNGSGDGNPRGPWGRLPSSGGGRGIRPPDFEDWFRRAQDRVRDWMPRGLGRGGLLLIALVVFGLWLASGFYVVAYYQRGVVMRFGRFVALTSEGINYHLPWPIETAYTPDVQKLNYINVGFKPAADSSDSTQTEDIDDESLMLTGDENIVDINFIVLWKIKDPVAFLFNVANPDDNKADAIKAVAESSMREIVGQNHFDQILTSQREEIQVAVQELMQKTLDSYGAGVFVIGIKMQKVEPPPAVRDAYIDVQKALADQDKKRNVGEAYANNVIPTARGQAAQIVQDAEAYRQQVIATASGEAKRFLSVLAEYRKAPDVTRRRMYIETMTSVLAPLNKVIVDDSAKGVVPYFQLPSMLKPQDPNAARGGTPAAPQVSAGQSSDQGAGQ
jgi:membrane protease subunit HflK